MKFVKTIGILLLFALLASTAAATTENKEMPTEKEVTAFVNDFKAPDSGDFANSAYDAFIEQYPAGHCDVWSNGMISLYFYDPDSPKEYGAIYLDNTGKEVKPKCGAEITCAKSYKGEAKTEVKENTKEDNQKVSEEKEDTKEEAVTEVKEEVKEDVPEEVPEANEEKEVTEDQNTPEEVKEENNTSAEINEDTPTVKETNDDKIQSIMKFFKTGDMNAKSLEICLYHYFGGD